MPIPTIAQVRAAAKKYGPIRLECCGCFMQHDGIRKIPKGWTKVFRVRSLRESMTTYEDGDPDPPPGYSVFDWETHAGLCPKCSKKDR